MIRQVGQMLVDSGYVDQPYVEAMLEREKSFSTFMGNGPGAASRRRGRQERYQSLRDRRDGFPEGTSWGDEKANIVIGIAAWEKNTFQILAVIADKMLAPRPRKNL